MRRDGKAARDRRVRVSLKHDEWCHVCGGRSTGLFAEVDVPNNAEGRDSWSRGHRAYVRFCGACSREIGRAAEAKP